MLTLVIGMPGSGKTTWARQQLGDVGLCYDLDAVAGALRLKAPHEEQHYEARQAADGLMPAVVEHLRMHTDELYVLRTAPAEDELFMLAPDRLVVCTHVYARRGLYDPMRVAQKIARAEAWAKWHGVPVEYVGPPPGR